MDEFTIETKKHEEIVDVTLEAMRCVEESGVMDGVCTVFVPHTTAGIIINENADPDVGHDILVALNSMVKNDFRFRHAEGNSPAHVKAMLAGCSVTVPVVAGKLALGTWQGIHFLEFDGPRTRHIRVAVR